MNLDQLAAHQFGLTVQCSYCLAPVDEPCRNRANGQLVTHAGHPARLAAAGVELPPFHLDDGPVPRSETTPRRPDPRAPRPSDRYGAPRS